MALTPLFLYGTLRHLPLLETVLGRPLKPGDVKASVLPGASATWVKDAPFPMIRLNTDRDAQGLLLVGASENEVARLDFYEGGFGYALTGVTTIHGDAARVYVPGPDVGEPGDDFELDVWAEQWGPLSIIAAEEVMSYFGARSSKDVARMFPNIRKRASVKLRAPDVLPGPDVLHGQWKVDEVTNGYSDFFKLDDYTIRMETFDGTLSEPMRRAVFVAMDAALLLPYDPVRDRVMVVEQFRVGPVVRGDAYPWLIEPIAGHVDPGETPEQAARREAQEEAGLELGALETINLGYPSSGASSEYFYMYAGIADLPDGITGVSGLASEGENIRSHLMSFESLMDMIDTQRCANLPLVLMGHWLARHRERLRQTFGAG